MDARDRERLEVMAEDGGAELVPNGQRADGENASDWFDAAMSWQDELIGLTGRVDPEFCALLRPLNERFVLLDEDAVVFKDRQHRFNVSAIATQVKMLEKWIMEHVDEDEEEARGARG